MALYTLSISAISSSVAVTVSVAVNNDTDEAVYIGVNVSVRGALVPTYV